MITYVIDLHWRNDKCLINFKRQKTKKKIAIINNVTPYCALRENYSKHFKYLGVEISYNKFRIAGKENEHRI